MAGNGQKNGEEHMAAAAANQNNSTFTCRNPVPGSMDSQSEAEQAGVLPIRAVASRSM